MRHPGGREGHVHFLADFLSAATRFFLLATVLKMGGGEKDR
jgi:hypothetical protein